MTNLKTLQEQAREEMDYYHDMDCSAATSNIICVCGLWKEIDSLILQAVTEAYKADEIERKEIPLQQHNYDEGMTSKALAEIATNWRLAGFNIAGAEQKAKQRAFLGEGE